MREQNEQWRPLFMVALPFVLSLVLNLPALSSSFMPTNDTFFSFSGFGAFAKHLRQFGEIPLWMPTSAFGGPADWRQMHMLSPCNWLFALVAAVFDKADILLLFKLSLLLEQSLFGLSCVWLAGLLFRRTTAKVFFVIAAVMASGSWNQIIFNLRYVAPVPWMIGLLLLAFRRQSRVLLLASLLPVPIAAYGLSFYCLAYLSLLWSVALIVQLAVHREGGFAWLTARPKQGRLLREAGTAAALIFLAGLVAGQLLLVMSGQRAISPHRDPATGNVALTTYLHYVPATNLPALVYSSALAAPDFAHWKEAYLYVGMTAFSLGLLGVVFVRSRSARLARWLLLFTVVFACSGFLTAAFYWLPLMSNLRHIAYTGIVARFFFCLVGAFGVQFLLDTASRKRLVSSQTFVRTPLLVALFFSLSLPIPAIWSDSAANEYIVKIGPGTDLIIASLATGLIFGLGIWAAARFLPQRRAVTGISVVVLGSIVASAWLLHGKIFERETWSLTPALADYARQSINAPLFYVPVRGVAGSEMEQTFISGFHAHGERYDTMDSMLSRDAPTFVERSDVVPEGVFRLLALKQNSPGSYPFFFMPLQPKVFLAEDPRGITTDYRVQMGDVLVETGSGIFAMKRRDVANIAVQDYSFNHVSFALPAGEIGQESTRRRFLVYMDALHPEWQALVDGRAATIQAANIAFKAVELPPGAREVSFRFGSGLRRTLALLNALAASLSVALQLAGLLFLGGTFVRRVKHVPDDHQHEVYRPFPHE